MTVSSVQFLMSQSRFADRLIEFLKDNGANEDQVDAALEKAVTVPEESELNAADDADTFFLQKLLPHLPAVGRLAPRLTSVDNDGQLNALLLVSACGLEYKGAAQVSNSNANSIKQQVYRARTKAGIPTKKGEIRKPH